MAMNKLMTLVSLALGVTIAGACDSSDDLSDADTKDTYSVAWNPTHGFGIDGADSVAIDAAARSVRTVVHYPEGQGPAMILWAVGDDVSVPFLTLPQDLPSNDVWPDVIMPATITPGTQLKLWTVLDGKLDKPVTDITVDSVSTRELPYWSKVVTRSSCLNYCDSAECGNNCNWGSVCGSDFMYNQGPKTHAHSASYVCTDPQNCTNNCPGGDSHLCWYTTETVYCTP
jgi:hypothetical protein